MVIRGRMHVIWIQEERKISSKDRVGGVGVVKACHFSPVVETILRRLRCRRILLLIPWYLESVTSRGHVRK